MQLQKACQQDLWSATLYHRVQGYLSDRDCDSNAKAQWLAQSATGRDFHHFHEHIRKEWRETYQVDMSKRQSRENLS